MPEEQLPKQKLPSVIKLYPGYDIIKFPWGAAIKDLRNGQWSSVHFPDGQELNLEELDVELSDIGIKFI